MTATTVDPSSGALLTFYSARHGLAQPRDIQGEKMGQVYGAALLAPRSDGRKRMVLSAGWPDSKGRLRFALLIVRENREGIWRPDGRIDGIGRAGDLAVTGDGSILAVTSDPAGGEVAHPALTLVSSGGSILATYFPRDAGIDRRDQPDPERRQPGGEQRHRQLGARLAPERVGHQVEQAARIGAAAWSGAGLCR